jgi:signal transduction histidine kinase
LHARGDYDGAGIGLAIVRQAADRQNGRVSVETRPNEGSVFTVSIPRALASRRVA